MNNLTKRTLSGLLFGVIMIFMTTFDKICFFCLFWALMTGAMKEFFAMSLGGSMKRERLIALICACCAFIASFLSCCVSSVPSEVVSVLYLASFLSLLLVGVSCIFRADNSDFGNVSFVYAALLYIALPVVLAPKLVMDGEIYDGWMLLSFFFVIWGTDVGAYFVGSALGQRPGAKRLAPSISPKKSWWGFGGGVFVGTAVAVGLHYLTWLPFSLVHCIALGVIISVAGVCGDLVESLWKRYFHVKDSGNAIPGHGGVLDRFDSSLAAIPAAAIYLSLFNLI